MLLRATTDGLRKQALAGALLVVVYTGLIAAADGITKLLAGQYAAAQLYALSGGMVVAMCLLADRLPQQRRGFATRCPRAMALRSLATLVAAVCFFYAFRSLPFADVFVFIGLMPLLAGVLSGVVLGEAVRPSAWLALLAGFAGVLFLFPDGVAAIGFGHLIAFVAAVSGVFSMVMARFIGRYECNALAQVFYPNLCLCLVMAVLLPFVWQPMPLVDVAWAVGYALLLFAARWLVVVALRLLAAHVVTPLMNLQFIWMVLIGALFFGELPAAATWLGGVVVIISGLYLVWDQLTPAASRSSGYLQTDP